MKARRTVVFLNRFYWPDVAATGQMLTDLAESLARDGWDVRVVTSRSRYAAAGALPKRETRGGVNIRRVAGTRFGRAQIVGRLADYASYVAGAVIAVLRAPVGSIFVGMSDPPLLATLALLGARVRRGRAVYWVQDLFPDLAVSLGSFRGGGLAHRLTARLARFVERRCDLVVALGPAMAERLAAHGTRADRIRVIHNWADCTAIRPVSPPDNAFLEQHGLCGQFVVLYSGNAGRAHTFDAVIDAMGALSDQPDVVFLFIGGGHRMPEIAAAAERLGLRNVRFLDYLPREELQFSLSAASVSLVTEDPRVVGQLVPSKTYGILASGRPTVFVGSDASDVARIVTEAGAGLVVDPSDGRQLVAALEDLRHDRSRRTEMGRRARAAAEGQYDRAIATRTWSAVLASL
jgi:glycosyltransferase involved in cell wall biosynthesis